MAPNTPMAFLTRMPVGVPGALTRPDLCAVESQIMDGDNPVTAFGAPVKIGPNGNIQPLAAGDAAADVYGFLTRPWPSLSGGLSADLSQGFADGAPWPRALCAVMTRGYMTVHCAEGAPAKNGQVYARVAPGAGNKPVGQIEAAAVDNETVAVDNCIFMGPADADGVTEIRFWR